MGYVASKPFAASCKFSCRPSHAKIRLQHALRGCVAQKGERMSILLGAAFVFSHWSNGTCSTIEFSISARWRNSLLYRRPRSAAGSQRADLHAADQRCGQNGRNQRDRASGQKRDQLIDFATKLGTLGSTTAVNASCAARQDALSSVPGSVWGSTGRSFANCLRSIDPPPSLARHCGAKSRPAVRTPPWDGRQALVVHSGIRPGATDAFDADA